MASPLTETTYTSHELCDLSGITYRQMDYWTRQGYLTCHVDAAGSGSRRAFTFEQVRIAALVGTILEAIGRGGGNTYESRISEIVDLAARAVRESYTSETPVLIEYALNPYVKLTVTEPPMGSGGQA